MLTLKTESQCEICTSSPYHCKGNLEKSYQGQCPQFNPSKILIETKNRQPPEPPKCLEATAKKTAKFLKWLAY